MEVIIVLLICSQCEISHNEDINIFSTKEAIKKLKQKVLQNCLNINKLNLAIQGTVLDTENEVVKSREFECKYWLDGEKIRNDFTWKSGVSFAGVRQISGLNIEKSGYGFTGSSESDVASRSFSISTNKVGKNGTNIDKTDLRILGMFNCAFGILGKFNPSTFLLDDTIKDPCLNKIVYKGKFAYELTWKRPNGVASRAVFLPEAGNGIVLLEDKADGMVQSTETDLVFFPKSKIYFPVKIEYFQKIKEGYSSTEKIEIKVELINEPIPEDIFTFSGLGLPEGSLIMDYSNSDDPGRTFKKIVNGKAIDAKPNPPTDPKPKAQPIPIQGKPGGGLWNLAYIVAGVASLTVGVLALYIVRFRASKS